MFLVPGVIYYLFSTALSFSHIQSLSSAKVTELQAVIESAIGKTSGQFLSRGLTDDLENVLTSLVDNTAVSGAIVFDVDSSIFAQAGDLNLTGDIKAFEHPIYHQTIVPDFEGIDFNDGVSKSNPVQIGVLQFYVDIESTMDQSWKAAIGDSLMLLITILICSPFFFALYQSFHIPLSSILDNILKFEQGKYDWIEAHSGDDEFSRVKQALVRVANTVNEQTKQISEANSALELRAFELERQIGFATEAREEADKATTQKDIFVANVTHEMRHPLVGVVSGVDLMEQFILCAQNRLMELNREATPEQHILLKSIRADLKDAINGLSISKKCSKELTLMVDELLASIQDMYHEITLHPSTFILYDSLIVLLKSHADQALVKGLDYKFDINGLTADSQTYVKGDWVRLSQVVNSLIDNAIRFTDQGCVDIVIDIVSKDNGVKLLIAVSDSGVGISSHEQESIFKLFHIGEDPTHKKHAGLGTGLTIAQKIANRMKGELNLDCSTIGEGSRFSFNITLPLSKAANMLPEYSDSLPICQKRISLLYVEDSRLNRQVFQMYCELSNIDLILAKDGIEGFEKYNSHRFDALIVDCFMPVMNGFELVEKIRQKELNEDSDHIAIFALTADASTRNRERCFEAGYDEFLTKPYTNASFRFILDRIKRINLKYQRS
jgi:signal transduction histidine kinase/CheY-like chemotaxis protein